MKQLSELFAKARRQLNDHGNAIGRFVTGFGRQERQQIALVALTAVVTVAYGYFAFFRAPSDFPVLTALSVPEGMTLSEVSEYLAAHEVVRSGTVFRTTVWLLGGEGAAKAGVYFFERPLTVIEVATRVLNAEYGLKPIKVRIPEGATSYQIAEILHSKLGTVDANEFMEAARRKEGYLFPDTYYFLPDASVAQIIDVMERNFYDRLKPLEKEIAHYNLPLHEVVTLASLLEKEANTFESKRMIAGIIENRLKKDMPLQIDAVFGYIKSTKTFSPKFSDLKIDSPYNTYKNKGLPPGPIASPSLSSIEAAITPEQSDYLYYLTGRNGKMYYSKNFSQHLSYKNQYLR